MDTTQLLFSTASIAPLLEHAGLAVLAVNREGSIVAATAPAAELLGATPGGLRGRSLAQALGDFGARLADHCAALWADAEAYGQECEDELCVGDVRRRLRVRGFAWRPSPDHRLLVLSLSDVSQQRSTEDALRRRSDLYAMLSRTNRAILGCTCAEELYQRVCEIAVETAHIMFAWVGVRDDRVVRVAARAGDDRGYMRQLVVTLDDDDARGQGPTAQSFLTGESYVMDDFLAHPMTRPWHAQARAAGIATSATVPISEGGQVVAVLNLYADVTGFFTPELLAALLELPATMGLALEGFRRERERRQQEEALRLLDRAMRALSQGICIVDAQAPDMPIIYVSPSFETMTGYGAAEFLGRNGRFLQGELTDADARRQLREAIVTHTERTVELINYRRDGTPFWNSVSVSPVRDEQQRVTHYVGVQTDVSARHALEQQLRQAQKMEALGRLAGGVAHDFNNVLTIINGYTAMLMKRHVDDQPLCDTLAEVLAAGQRAVALTRQLLAFSRQRVIEPKVLDPNTVIRELESMLTRLLGEDVRLTLALDDTLASVRADQGQLDQVLVNLAVNARDAMPRGGEIRVVTRNAAHEGVEGVLIAVSDSGLGMDAATQQRVFEPFFTTKPVGRGTGLGLATVYGIVNQWGGRITLRSTPGVGTTFDIWLPRAQADEAPEAPRAAPLPVAASGTVLLAEDDDAVRGYLHTLLTEAGYRVLAASDGAAALTLLEQQGSGIDLVVTDVVMPGASGQDLADAVVAAGLPCKLVFMSGYLQEHALQAHIDAGCRFLHKPVSPELLLHTVGALLGGAP
ncbi:MAG: PAS domain-containing protein [Gammaproteobacteria bacterium]